jgi:hypothetical protein
MVLGGTMEVIRCVLYFLILLDFRDLEIGGAVHVYSDYIMNPPIVILPSKDVGRIGRIICVCFAADLKNNLEYSTPLYMGYA